MTGRVEGYRGALLEHRIKFDETLVVDGIDVGVEAGYSAAKKLLDRNTRPTAMIALNNLLVLGALNAIKEKGLMIPQDIALIGCVFVPCPLHVDQRREGRNPRCGGVIRRDPGRDAMHALA